MILVYDVNNPESFENVNFWIENLSEHVDPTNSATILVGNKCDLKREI